MCHGWTDFACTRAECFRMGIFLSGFPLIISMHLEIQSNSHYSLVFKLLTLEIETQSFSSQRNAEEEVLSFKTRLGNLSLWGHDI